MLMKKIFAAAALAAALVLTGYAQNAGHAGQLENGDLFIPLEEVSETAVFYPVTIDGVYIEVFAVKAPDGSVRTAFNTCQVCYKSGKGYYVQDGAFMVCQKCGNRFSTGDIEITHGGCNPVPITTEDKTIDEHGITVPKDFMATVKHMFAVWKK